MIPSLLYQDAGELHQRFLECVAVTSEAHVDFADGIFVPNRLPSPEVFKDFPGQIALEAHLMVQEPQNWVEQLLEDQRFERIIVHAEADGDLSAMFEKIKKADRMAGVALKPETSIEVLNQWANQIDQVLLLFVDPGFNGSPYQPEVLAKIDQIRNAFGELVISADGGMRPETMVDVVGSGVTRIAVGSYLHGKPLSGGLRELRQVVDQAAGRVG